MASRYSSPSTTPKSRAVAASSAISPGLAGARPSAMCHRAVSESVIQVSASLNGPRLCPMIDPSAERSDALACQTACAAATSGSAVTVPRTDVGIPMPADTISAGPENPAGGVPGTASMTASMPASPASTVASSPAPIESVSVRVAFTKATPITIARKVSRYLLRLIQSWRRTRRVIGRLRVTSCDPAPRPRSGWRAHRRERRPGRTPRCGCVLRRTGRG